MKLSYIVVKAMRVIRSCETLEQLRVAENYCNRVNHLVPKKYKRLPSIFIFPIMNQQQLIEKKAYFYGWGRCAQMDDEIDAMIRKEVMNDETGSRETSREIK